jgi:hypothetical protein
MILFWETVVAFTPTGWLLAVTAWRDRDRAVDFSTAWFVSAVAFYVIAARTSSDTWAFYYHILSVAPAALLIGAGYDRFDGGSALPARWQVRQTWQRRIGRTFVVAVVTVFGAGTAVLIHKRDAPTRTEQLLYECSRRFSGSVPRTGQIVVRGGRMFDVYGRPVAYNESMVFAWMDRKGFNYGAEEFSLETIEAIARRGGRFWMVARGDLDDSGLRQEVIRRYDVVSTCEDTFWLVDLGARDRDVTAVP